MLALVIGGSGSGKSEYAENLAVRLDSGQKLYIATMYPWDEESKERIEKHRKMRAAKKFDTLECFYNLGEKIKEYRNQEPACSTAFLDCMSNLVANEMYSNDGIVHLRKGESVVEHVLAGVDLLCEKFHHVVIVSNDVFTDGQEYDEEMQKYLKNLAMINAGIAKRANLVAEVVCGIPVIQKGTEESVHVME